MKFLRSSSSGLSLPCISSYRDTELLEVVYKLVLDVTDVVNPFTGQCEVDEVDVLVVFGILQFFEEHYDVVTCYL